MLFHKARSWEKVDDTGIPGVQTLSLRPGWDRRQHNTTHIQQCIVGKDAYFDLSFLSVLLFVCNNMIAHWQCVVIVK